MKKVLVTGGRSGTTFVASMLGAHPDVSMVDEQRSWPTHIGCLWSGNKLPIGNIHWDMKASRLGHLWNKIEWLGNEQYIRTFPTANFTLQELLDEEAFVIIVERDGKEIVDSMVNRTNISRQLATKKVLMEQLELEVVQEKFGNRCLALRYTKNEDVKKHMCVAMCDHLLLDFDDVIISKMLISQYSNSRYGKV